MVTTEKMGNKDFSLYRKSNKGKFTKKIQSNIQNEFERETIQNTSKFGNQSVFVKPLTRQIGYYESQLIYKEDIWFNYASQKDMLNIFMIALNYSETIPEINNNTTVDEIISFINNAIIIDHSDGCYDLNNPRFENTYMSRYFNYDTESKKVVLKESYDLDGEWFWQNSAPYIFSSSQKNPVEKRISELFSTLLAKLGFYHMYILNESEFITINDDEISSFCEDEFLVEDIKKSISNIKNYIQSKTFIRKKEYSISLYKMFYNEIVNEIVRIIPLLKESKKKNDYQKFSIMLQKFYLEYIENDIDFLQERYISGLSIFCNFFMVEDNEIGNDFLKYHSFLVGIDLENSGNASSLNVNKGLYNDNSNELAIFNNFVEMIDLFNKIQIHDYRRKNISN